MSTDALFVESVSEALREAVRVCGGAKAVGVVLWPDKAADSAGRLLADCLNEHRSERLTPDQVVLVMRLARERGCHVVMTYLARECGYADPVPIEPEDERARLQREYIDAVRALQALTKRLETSPALRSAA